MKSNSNTISNTSGYTDTQYLLWKEWGINNFAKLNAEDRRYFDAELRYFSSQKPDFTNALEVGFGNGKFLQYCLDKGWSITGTEINPLLVEIAQENGFEAVLSENLSELSSNQFDLVAAFDVLEHLPQDQILFFLQQVNRVLKCNGVCILRFPNRDSPFGLYNQNGDVTHINAIGSEKIEYFANQTPLKLICCRGECEPLLEKTILQTLRRAISLFFKKIINIFVFLIFYKKRNYCSDNLVVIFQKEDTQIN